MYCISLTDIKLNFLRKQLFLIVKHTTAKGQISVFFSLAPPSCRKYWCVMLKWFYQKYPSSNHFFTFDTFMHFYSLHISSHIPSFKCTSQSISISVHMKCQVVKYVIHCNVSNNTCQIWKWILDIFTSTLVWLNQNLIFSIL